MSITDDDLQQQELMPELVKLALLGDTVSMWENCNKGGRTTKVKVTSYLFKVDGDASDQQVY